MQSKLLLAASTVQQIIDEFQEVHNVGKEYFAHQLTTTLQGLLVNEQQIKDVVEESMKDDLWKMCNDIALRSDHTRKTSVARSK